MMDACSAEVARVSHHIERAERHAERQDVSRLGHVQRILRQLLLQELARYRAGGRFPKNRDFGERTPYFVDAGGVRCAMAHLLELGGGGALVEQIARERNHARIRELVDEPRLLAWLDAAGLSVAEAAAIQPAYCSDVTDCVCGGTFSSIDYPVPARGVLEGVVLTSGAARVERTYGDALGIEIGTEVQLTSTYPSGTRILAPIDSATAASFGSVALDTEGLYACRSQGVSNAPDLDPEQFAQAVMAQDCAAALRTMDPAWRDRQGCDGDPPLPPPGGDGCSAGANGEAASIGILLALVTAIAHRRPARTI
ncbi:MAG TPA: hypothetical protein VK932_01885 [Kofleriaceae bacterium]|nr:hypothetical protein [Kofleriaceae bacterium]